MPSTPEEAAAVGAAARAGGVILFPTDTLYGLGADPCSPAGLAAIFRLKGARPAKPLPVLLADASLVGRYAAAVPGALAGADGALLARAADAAVPGRARPPARDLFRVGQGRPPGARQRAVPVGAAAPPGGV